MTAAQHVTLTSSSTGCPSSWSAPTCRRTRSSWPRWTRSWGPHPRPASDLLDRGHGIHEGVPVALVPEADALAAVLPGNLPASSRLPSLALKVPVVLRPSSSSPDGAAPHRGHGGCGCAAGGVWLLPVHPRRLGGDHRSPRPCAAVRRSRHGASLADPAVEVHGPGYSKVVLCPDQADAWEQHLDVIETSAKNGGRSCINASTVVDQAWAGDR